MKIAVRCIFTRPITPNFLVINLDGVKWQKFLWGDKNVRIGLVTPYLTKAHCSIREIAWIPLDELTEEDKAVMILNVIKS